MVVQIVLTCLMQNQLNSFKSINKIILNLPPTSLRIRFSRKIMKDRSESGMSPIEQSIKSFHLRM